MICEGPATERRWLVKLRTAVWPIAIFFLSLWLRTRNLDADVYGDEAYYYYLCMYPERYLTLYRNHPPLTYLVYHAAAESVQATRILNATIGASIPVVVYVYLKGSKSSVRVLASILAATATVLVRYSGLVFPDTFSSFLFLVGLLLYEKRRWLPASGLLGLSALAKEYAVLGAAILICISYFRYRSLRIAVLLGFGLALAGPVLYYFMFHLGGSYFLLFVAHDDPLRSIWNLFLFLSLLAILLAGLLGHLEEFVISSAYAVFIVFGVFGLIYYLFKRVTKSEAMLRGPFCISCGSKLPDNSVFCDRCGKRRELPSRETQPTPSLGPPTHSSNRRQKFIVGAILVLVLSVAIVAGFYVFIQPQQHQTSWREIKRFSGSAYRTTETFHVPTMMWRIQWSYGTSDYAAFWFFVYPAGETALFVEMVSSSARSDSGVTYIYRGFGSFYLKILAANIQYKIIIEVPSS